ncbi:hypothetical protein A33Q_3504 [Indibacter alkaliphilus LW1]|uniref:Antitoxin component YwqK of the YwqJK toxin-antitoxin module n=1 Tax=Indibacter alkaliphilus (strain CCUG 57479 / KCTC 22604 / LW1) TaxID=1189612 RepID=S2DUU8_INDAL|nr:hypothetical protein [Indibacter alkaliphilus]EOZ93558.1 hypothetical protein A33Q_3504 [Indibacter alkaliphilus LW1]
MKKTLSLLFLLVIAFYAEAQQTYSGEYTFNGLRGEGVFEFVEGEGDAIIKQGEFKFLRKEIDVEDRTVFYKTEVYGFYDQDLKTGKWEYQDEVHRAELEDVIEFKLEYDLNSEQIILTAEYKEGVPHGKWIFLENEFRDGKLSPKSQADDFNFNNGDIQGRFQYRAFVEGKTHFIRGEVNRQGYMNGEWTFVYREGDILVSEVRKYENGFLLGVVKRDLETNSLIEEVVFYQTIRKLNAVNAGENKGFRVSEEKFGIQFNDGFLSGSEQFAVQEEGNDFINEFLTNILRYDAKFVNERGELVEYPLHTKKFVFELSRNEQRIVEDLPGKFDELQTTVRDYAERNALRLNRQKSDSLSFAYDFFQHQVERLAEFNEIMGLFRTKQIQFYDLQYLASEGLPFLKELDLIEYTFEDSTLTKEIEYKIGDIEESFYSALSDYISQMSDVTSKVKAYVDNSLTRIERDDDLRSIEAQIRERKDELEEKFLEDEEQDQMTKEILQAIHDNILETGFDQLNERYAKEENFDEKKETARVMLDLLDEMESLYEPLSEISQRAERLDQLYMEEIFNPFTYTRYDQRAKPRLYESAEKVMEYYIDELKSESDYTQIKSWVAKLDRLFERMGELREADTRREERRINRRQSVSRIESLLEL